MKIFQTLFHATPTTNLLSIIDTCIDPARSTGKRNVVWLSSDLALAWAVLHVAQRYDLKPSEISVCVVAVTDDALRRTRWQSVYTSNIPLVPTNYLSVAQALQDYERLLSKIERNERIKRGARL